MVADLAHVRPDDTIGSQFPRADVLITAPLPVVGDETNEGISFHRLWEAGDLDQFLEAAAARIRGIAAGGRLRVDAALLDRLPKVEIVASFGVGYDRVDVGAASVRGIVVTNTPDVLTEEVADLALGMLLATLRDIPRADRFVRDGLWPKGSFPLSSSLRGRTVGIVGLGRIGKAIARRLEACGVSVVYHGRNRQADTAHPFFASLIEMAQAVDTLVVSAPGTASTEGLVSRDILEALGPDGVLVNVGQGTLVDEPALIDALRSGAIRAAGLDVFSDEPNVPAALSAIQNVVLLPHVGSGSTVTRDAMGRLVQDNLLSCFAGRGPLTPVPETPWSQPSSPSG